MGRKTRIMYIEYKGDSELVGDARIGRVAIFNKGKFLCYQNQSFPRCAVAVSNRIITMSKQASITGFQAVAKTAGTRFIRRTLKLTKMSEKNTGRKSEISPK